VCHMCITTPCFVCLSSSRRTTHSFPQKNVRRKTFTCEKNVHLTSLLLPLVDIKKLFKFTLAPYFRVMLVKEESSMEYQLRIYCYKWNNNATREASVIKFLEYMFIYNNHICSFRTKKYINKCFDTINE
jgi:hypothetical protein